jgi:signal peptidase II
MKRSLLLISLPLYVIDQITKWLIVFNFPEPAVGYNGSTKVVPVIDGFFNIVRVHNQGVAFGFGNGTMWAPMVFLCFSLCALTGLLWFWRRGGMEGRVLGLAAPLLVSGICGNVTDRLLQGFFLDAWSGESFLVRLSKGYVVDFLDFTIPLVNYRWPSFNVADSCITIAAFLLILSAFRSEGEAKAPEVKEG